MTVIEEVFETRPKQVHDECRVVALSTNPVHLGCTEAILKQLVQLCLVDHLGVLRFHKLHLYRYFVVSVLVDAEEDLAEGPTTQLCIQLILVIDEARVRRVRIRRICRTHY